jgi:hypothetical protein
MASISDPIPDEFYTARDELSTQYLVARTETLEEAESRPDSPDLPLNVVGVGIGEKLVGGARTGVLAVKILVRKKFPADQIPAEHVLPTTYGRLPIDVDEVGLPRFASPAPPIANPKTKLRPAPPGCSISPPSSTAGTFGGLVADSSGVSYMLSNNHVLALGNLLPAGSAILQPGPADGGTAADQIATLTRFVPVQAVSTVDCAIAKPTTPDLLGASILALGIPAGTAAVTPSMAVQKFGRTTRLTAGTVTTVGANVVFPATKPYPNVGAVTFTGQIVITSQTPGTSFAEGGDSGSLIIDQASGAAVALLFAVSGPTPAPPATPTYWTTTYANPIASALSALSVTLVGKPAITAIAPANGPEVGGTGITITGTGFVDSATVTVGGVAATGVTVVSATEIRALTPAGTGLVDVIVTTAGGASAPGQFTFLPVPIVAAISPDKGPETGGTSVTITGSAFAAPASVTVGGVAATTVTVVSATEITVTTPAGTGVADVVVNTPGGASAPQPFTYLPKPVIAAITPRSGPAAGGTSVVITGTDFVSPADVAFGATTAAVMTVDSATQITVTSPAGTGVVDVVVTTPGGASAPGDFNYIPEPVITALNPDQGPEAGGTTVTITGNDFSAPADVAFGSTGAADVVVVSDTEITAVTPAGTGIVDVVVTTAGGASAPGQFAFRPKPAIAAISPDTGPDAGGTSVTITGTGFADPASVAIGGVAATAVTVVSAVEITVTTPAGTGVADVVVSTPDGVSAPGQFTFLARPAISAIRPDNGPAEGGTSVVITGTGFVSPADVAFGATTAAVMTVDSATQITVTSPAGTGVVDVVVTTPGGASAPASFTYLPKPVITALDPDQGPAAGGTIVTITGSDFSTPAEVAFGSTSAADVSVDSDTQITVTSPTGVGTEQVTVTTAGGTSEPGYRRAPVFEERTIRPNDVIQPWPEESYTAFTYIPRPVITALNPDSGPEAGGTSVTITGTSFMDPASVAFGSTSATDVSVDSETQITAKSPAGSGDVQVTVTTAGGTSEPGYRRLLMLEEDDSGRLGGPITTFDPWPEESYTEFSYIPKPAITDISPDSGPEEGGTSVVITGTGFLDPSEVGFDVTSAADVAVDSDSQITATSPAGTGTVDVSVTTAGGASAPGHFTYEHDDAPYDDTPYDDTPYDDTPYDDTPYDDTPYDDTPYDDTPYDDKPYDDTPYDDKPYDDHSDYDDHPYDDHSDYDDTPYDDYDDGSTDDG